MMGINKNELQRLSLAGATGGLFHLLWEMFGEKRFGPEEELIEKLFEISEKKGVMPSIHLDNHCKIEGESIEKLIQKVLKDKSEESVQKLLKVLLFESSGCGHAGMIYAAYGYFHDRKMFLHALKSRIPFAVEILTGDHIEVGVKTDPECVECTNH